MNSSTRKYENLKKTYTCYTARKKPSKAIVSDHHVKPEQYNLLFRSGTCHIKIVKWLGVMGIILVTLCVPVYILASMEWSNNNPMDYEVKVQANQTACSYLKQFDLKDIVILSVYHRDGELSIDIRLFLNETATIRGILLNLMQWNVLQRVSSSVNRAIEEAKNL